MFPYKWPKCCFSSKPKVIILREGEPLSLADTKKKYYPETSLYLLSCLIPSINSSQITSSCQWKTCPQNSDLATTMLLYRDGVLRLKRFWDWARQSDLLDLLKSSALVVSDQNTFFCLFEKSPTCLLLLICFCKQWLFFLAILQWKPALQRVWLKVVLWADTPFSSVVPCHSLTVNLWSPSCHSAQWMRFPHSSWCALWGNDWLNGNYLLIKLLPGGVHNFLLFGPFLLKNFFQALSELRYILLSYTNLLTFLLKRGLLVLLSNWYVQGSTMRPEMYKGPPKTYCIVWYGICPVSLK